MFILSKMFKSVWSHLASLATIITIIFLLTPDTTKITILMGLLIGLSIIFFIITIIQEYNDVVQKYGKHYEKKEEIRNFMYYWIKNGGRVTIFTRDMSWVDDHDDEIKGMLVTKAKKNELTIVLQEPISLSKKLQTYGASIITYQEIDYIPKTRFTIINTDKSDSIVAIGRKSSNNKHFIQTFSTSDEPEFSLATDLVKILEKYNNLMKELKNSGDTASKIKDRH